MFNVLLLMFMWASHIAIDSIVQMYYSCQLYYDILKTARRSNQSILKEISPGCSLEGMMLKVKVVLWPPHAKSWLIGKDSDAGRNWGQEEKGTTEDEMAGWHHRLDGHESGWWWTGRPGVLQLMGLQRVGHDWASELNWKAGFLDQREIYICNFDKIL